MIKQIHFPFVLGLKDNVPRLSQFIDGEKFKDYTFTLANEDNRRNYDSVQVEYRDGDWMVVGQSKRALIWKGENLIYNVKKKGEEVQDKEENSESIPVGVPETEPVIPEIQEEESDPDVEMGRKEDRSETGEQEPLKVQET